MENSDQNKDAESPDIDIYEPHTKTDFFQIIRFKIDGFFDKINLRPLIAIIAFVVLILLLPIYSLLQPVFAKIFALPPRDLSGTLNQALAPIEIADDIKIVTRTPNSSVAVVHLRNINKNHGLSDLVYSWQALSDDSTVLASGTGTTFILPGDDRFLALPISGSLPSDVTFTLNEHIDKFKSPDFASIEPEIINLIGSNTSEGFVVTGKMRNTSAYRLVSLDLVAVLRSPKGAILGAVSTTVDDLTPQDLRTFNLVWPKSLPSDTIVDIRIYINTLSGVNLVLPPVTIEEPEPR